MGNNVEINNHVNGILNTPHEFLSFGFFVILKFNLNLKYSSVPFSPSIPCPQVADANKIYFGWKKSVSYILTLDHPSGSNLGLAKHNP